MILSEGLGCSGDWRSIKLYIRNNTFEYIIYDEAVFISNIEVFITSQKMQH